MPAAIHAVLVHHRRPELTCGCLDGLAEQGGRMSVTVVDVGGSEGGGARVEAHVAARGLSAVTVVRAPDRGLAAGLNVGLSRTLPEPAELLLILHPDTRLRPGALRVMKDYLQSHPGVGIVGPRYVDAAGATLPSAFRFPTVLGEVVDGLAFGPVTAWLHHYKVAPPMRAEAHVTDWLGGAALLVRAEVLEAVGPLDEGYQQYFGDVDLCRRAQRASWTCAYVPQAVAVHTPTSSGAAASAPPARWFSDRQRYFEAHHGVGEGVLADVALGLTSSLTALRRRVVGKQPARPGLVRGLLRHRAGQLASS
jgi:N-acetylglucosaminyl-diphospho-decaprenol L-rhamnosyltransferase